MSQFPKEQGQDGGFERQEDAFRSWISQDGSTAYPAVSGRYHLYVSLACPWASRTVIVRKLLGLENTIGLSVLDPIRDERGWAFREGDGYEKDPINGFSFLREAYYRHRSRFSGQNHRSSPLGQIHPAHPQQLRGRYLPHVSGRLRLFRNQSLSPGHRRRTAPPLRLYL